MENIRKIDYLEVGEIIHESNPEKIDATSGIGYWQIAELCSKTPNKYFTKNPCIEYYGVFDISEKKHKCIALCVVDLDVSEMYEMSTPDIHIQSLRKGAGMILLRFVMAKMKMRGYRGISIHAINPKTYPAYRKMGFEFRGGTGDGVHIYRFSNGLTDCVQEELFENYISAAYGDPTFTFDSNVVGGKTNRYNNGIIYNILPLSSSMSGHKQDRTRGYTYIHVGSKIKSKDKYGNTVIGRIYKIEKDGDGYITHVYIFNDEARVIGVSINDIVLAESAKQDCTIEQAVLVNKIRKHGTIELLVEGRQCYLTNYESDAVLCEMKDGYLTKMTSVFEMKDMEVKYLLKKIGNR